MIDFQGNLPSGMVPLMKRQAVDNKSVNGVPMFQPSAATAYQPAVPAMQVHQPYGPVTREYLRLSSFTVSSKYKNVTM